jgi:hypothetical protein
MGIPLRAEPPARSDYGLQVLAQDAHDLITTVLDGAEAALTPQDTIVIHHRAGRPTGITLDLRKEVTPP